jgi:hypothetical protein
MPMEISKWDPTTRTRTVIKKQGSVSVFSTGMGYGVILGVLAGLGMGYEVVAAKTWQTHFFKGISRTSGTKGMAYRVASGLYPNANLKGPRGGIKDGRVDALLIGQWAIDKSKGETL